MSYDIADLSMLREKIQPYLGSGESIQWVGQPDPTKLITPADWFMIPFSLFFSGFSVMWVVGVVSQTIASNENGPIAWIFPLFGLPFIAVGFFLLFGRFLIKKSTRLRTFYAVTNQRVLSLVEARKPRMSSLYLSSYQLLM